MEMNIKNWFEKYSSNTLAGSGSQTFFDTEKELIHRGRIYYKIFAGGSYGYSLLFSNILNSTFEDGSRSRCNMLCEELDLRKVTVGVCKECSEAVAAEPKNTRVLSFNGKICKHVMPGEIFASDEFLLSAEKDEYLCVEIEFSGTKIPYHEESILPAFIWEDGEWKASKKLPFPEMIGCDRKTDLRIGFLGDSITQGCGTPVNAYAHWCALAAEKIGERYSYWNLGFGYARAQDAASDGVWLMKAKQMDWVILCLGTNDIGQKRAEEDIKRDLECIVLKLKEAGVKMLLQTLPPFSWQGEELKKWLHINEYIKGDLSKFAEAVFDVAPFLTDSEQEGKAKYVEHPNEEGSRIWAEELVCFIRKNISGMWETKCE